ncbi:hypothetical protein AMTRI_Chr09g15160 [Amborella trichopoda]
MASPSDSWMREFNEASKLTDDISARIAERSSLPPLALKHSVMSQQFEGSLESLLAKLPSKQRMYVLHPKKELHQLQDMLVNLRSKANQMASTLNMSNFANRNNLLGQDSKPVSEINRTTGLDNYGLVGLQRQIMRDEGLEKLEETVISTKHIALAVNEELTLHTRLIIRMFSFVKVLNSTGSQLQRVQKRLAILNKKTKGGCSCMCLMLSVIAIVVLAVVVWALIKCL